MKYLDKEEFRAVIGAYYKDPNDEPNILRLNKMVELLIEKNKSSKCFSGYSFTSDMISDARFKVWRALSGRKFDITKPDPFSYFTSVIRNAFVDVIKKEKKFLELKDKMKDLHDSYKDQFLHA